jgi:Ulp1 family protease
MSPVLEAQNPEIVVSNAVHAEHIINPSSGSKEVKVRKARLVIITNADLERLNPGVFLNDNLVEFGLG